MWASVKVEMASSVCRREALGDPVLTFQDLKGAQQRWRDHFQGCGVTQGVLGTSSLLRGWLGCRGSSVRPGKEVWGCPRLAVSPLSWQPLSAGALLWVALAFALLFQPPPARARLFI